MTITYQWFTNYRNVYLYLYGLKYWIKAARQTTMVIILSYIEVEEYAKRISITIWNSISDKQTMSTTQMYLHFCEGINELYNDAMQIMDSVKWMIVEDGICSNGFIDLIVKIKNRQERNTDARLDAEKYVLMLLKTYCIDR